MPKRKCSFTVELQKRFPTYRPGRDKWEAECTMCKAGTYVSVSNKGAGDLKLTWTPKNIKKLCEVRVLLFFFRPWKSEDAVNAVEGAMAFHTVKHHNSTTAPCSQTEAIVSGVIAPHSVEVAHEALKTIQYCGVSTDGSNHRAVKIFPIIIQYFDWKKDVVQTKYHDYTPNETAETIAKYLTETLAKNYLSEKCIAFTGNNCNTNFGGLRRDEAGKNVFANLKRLLNCAHHGADTIDVDIENIMFTIYQYFHIYTVRTESLKEYCDFVEIDYRRMLSHSKTRCEVFCADVQGLYSACLEYLEKWMTPMEEFSTFMWMDLSEPPNWNDVEACIKYLGEKGVAVDDVKCSDQVANLKKFTERCNSDEEFSGLQVHQKWTKYFEKAKSLSLLLHILFYFITEVIFVPLRHNKACSLNSEKPV
uniref:Uncharacterized protein n=1 Tax=Sander lucioperca TaxID=283035 RepID=A0A8C9YPE1_SANLU